MARKVKGEQFKDTQIHPCEYCGSLVGNSEVSMMLNDKWYHGICYMRTLKVAGSPFQCAICDTKGPTNLIKREGFDVYACSKCVNNFNLTGLMLI